MSHSNPLAAATVLGVIIVATVVICLANRENRKMLENERALRRRRGHGTEEYPDSLEDSRNSEQIEGESKNFERLEQEEAAKQQRIAKNLEASVSNIEYLSGEIGRCIELTNEVMRKAEVDFSESAFGPFWDSIEEAASLLAKTEKNSFRIRLNIDEYKKLVVEFRSEPPSIPNSAKILNNGRRLISKMKRLVRAAQRDFYFASIYEQRKTNQILITGFKNLKEAMEGLGTSLKDSTMEIVNAISEMAEYNHVNTDQLVACLTEIRQGMENDEEESREHEARLETMLDNIQRKRRPRYNSDKEFD